MEVIRRHLQPSPKYLPTNSLLTPYYLPNISLLTPYYLPNISPSRGDLEFRVEWGFTA